MSKHTVCFQKFKWRKVPRITGNTAAQSCVIKPYKVQQSLWKLVSAVMLSCLLCLGSWHIEIQWNRTLLICSCCWGGHVQLIQAGSLEAHPVLSLQFTLLFHPWVNLSGPLTWSWSSVYTQGWELYPKLQDARDCLPFADDGHELTTILA